MANYIYGKVKRKQNLFRILATDTDVYDVTNLVLNGVEYNPSTLIEEEELYQLSTFSTSGFSRAFLSSNADSVNYDQINKVDLKSLSFICTIQNGLYLFQIVNSSFYISKKWFSIDELELENNKPIITINPIADAIYDKQNDILYFKKLSAANVIFKGMDQLYRAATDIETQLFLDKDFLEIATGFDKESVGVPNRKKIALVNEMFDKYSDSEKLEIYDYTSQYSKVKYMNGKFQIDTDDDLKFVLWGIEQRFYTTLIGGEKRIANSVIKI